jgi:hypothetical protein
LRADRAGYRAGRDFGPGCNQPSTGAAEFGIGQREFQPESYRLGMNRMRAADRWRHLMLVGAPLQRRQQGVDIGDENIARALQLHGEAGVEHIGRGHALMDETRFGADEFGQMGEEGDDVMLGDALDFVDARDIEGDMPGLFPDRFGGLLRDHADLGQSVAGMGFDFEPDAKARLRRPDRNHFGAGIAWDHRSVQGGEEGGPGLHDQRGYFERLSIGGAGSPFGRRDACDPAGDCLAAPAC